jgi:ADP-heptose:LPS heptosyltransferase
MRTAEEVLLIFQIGSMGDTVVSMPCYREIARRHPNATRYLLTNYPTGKKMVSAESILSGTGLIAGSAEYPMPLRGKDAIIELYERVRRLGAKTLYYLTPETKLHRLIRHYAFFRICGITSIHGVPWSRDLRYPRKLDGQDLWESEGSRLLRCIGARTEAGPPPATDRSLDLASQERSAALAPLQNAIGCDPFIAISVGGKVPVNDWGDGNWSALLSKLSREYPGLGGVFVGSADERARNEALAKSWEGPAFNSCGLFTPRQTAALLERACLFIGHDTGTLHLAAAAGTRIIGIYSARNVPGKWYSDRLKDTFLYNQIECFGCECVRVEECPNQTRCISSIGSEQVLAAVRQQLAALGHKPTVVCAR